MYSFKAEVLTPVHVGAGVELDPLSFTLINNQLVHFHIAQLVADLTDQDRVRFETMLERADLKEIQLFLRHQVDLFKHGTARVEVSDEFAKEFEKKAGNPDNSFRVDMMPRNPHTGTVYLPGSGIKGAIRTAVVNHFTNRVPEFKAKVHQAVKGAPKDKQGKVLEQVALDRLNHNNKDLIERDVFRLIDVEDVTLPDSSTRIDRAENWNPNKPDAAGIQMWFERCKAKAEGESTQFTVNLHIDEKAMQHPEVKRNLGRTIDLNTVMNACNHFYWGRLKAELDKFFPEKSDSIRQAIWKTIAIRGSDGKLQVSPPKEPQLLLRVGRFSHFESLSVDELRRGYNIRKRESIIGMGSTRTLCHIKTTPFKIPFGWMLLTLQ